MVRRLSLAAAVLVSLAVPAQAAWRFAIPGGWTDLSPGKPVPPSVPAAIAAVAHSGAYTVYAMDLEGARRDGFAENMNVIVQPRPVVADERTLARLVESLPEQARREVPGAQVTVRERSVVPVAGVPSLRVVVELASGGTTMRSLEYLIPGGDSAAQVTYSSSPAEFARYLPVFEAAVQRTQGAAPPPLGARIGSRILAATGLSAADLSRILSGGGALVGAGFAVLLLTFLSRRGRRKDAAAG